MSEHSCFDELGGLKLEYGQFTHWFVPVKGVCTLHHRCIECLLKLFVFLCGEEKVRTRKVDVNVVMSIGSHEMKPYKNFNASFITGVVLVTGI